MYRDVLRLKWPCLQFQRLESSEKIPRVVVNSFEIKVGLFM